jgi:ribosome-associated toxin RatA of RatAB toxin-antitoxin module
MRWSLLLLVLTSPALAQPVTGPTVNEAETAKLAAGEILVRDAAPTGGKGVASYAFGVVDAPPDEVFAIISNCKLFFQFMPRVKKSWVKTEPGVGELCHVELTMPFPLPDLWSDCTNEVREEPKGHYLRAWKMVRGTYHRNDGSWTIVPFGDGTKSIVVYTVDTDPKMAVPTGLIRLGQNTSLPEVITRIRQRVTTLRAAAPAAAAPSK